jgi:hypothetical protein
MLNELGWQPLGPCASRSTRRRRGVSARHAPRINTTIHTLKGKGEGASASGRIPANQLRETDAIRGDTGCLRTACGVVTGRFVRALKYTHSVHSNVFKESSPPMANERVDLRRNCVNIVNNQGPGRFQTDCFSSEEAPKRVLRKAVLKGGLWQKPDADLWPLC